MDLGIVVAQVEAARGVLDHLGDGHVGRELGAHPHRAGPGAAAAVGRGEGLVQVQVHHVEPGVAHAHLAQDGVQVGPVVVEQGVHGAQHLHDAGQVALEEPQGVGAGHHHAGHGVVQHALQGGRVHDAVPGLDGHHLVAGDGRRGRVGAVGRVRHDDLGLRVALVGVVGGDDEHAREFAVGSGQGVQGELVHAGDLAQPAFGLVHDLQRALGQLVAARQLGHQGVDAGEAGQPGHVLAELGVVLHGAGAQGVEIGVHPEVLAAQGREVAHHVQLRQGRHERRLGAQKPLRQHGGSLRARLAGPDALAAGGGFGEYGAHRASSSRVAMMSMSERECFSVQQTSRAFSRPG